MMYSGILWLLLCCLTHQYATALTCLNCTNVSDAASCKSTITCSGNQECFTATSGSSTDRRFSFGCKSDQECMVLHNAVTIVGRKRVPTVPQCQQCCAVDRCNEKLCSNIDHLTVPWNQVCEDDPSYNCAGISSLFGLCNDIHHAKQVCRKWCGLCDLVDGGWSAWSPWSSCSVTCEDGHLIRIRTCTHPAPAHEGLDCAGNNTDTKTCHNDTPCPVHGGWSSWLSWEACSTTCGIGIKRRNRTCTNPVPAHNGRYCRGDVHDSDLCQAGPCSGVDGGWSSWLSWGQCSVSCGSGIRSRLRSCTNPAPDATGRPCVGDAHDYSACQASACVQNAVWEAWTAWQGCSVTCGGGMKTRSRNCTQEAGVQGAGCTGNRTDSQACNTTPCPVDGVWSQWSSLSTCPVTCGGGTVTRTRTCNYLDGVPHGYACIGLNVENTTCSTNDCPVDGALTSWSAWTACTVTCGSGTRRRDRKCVFELGKPLGANCTGLLQEAEDCNTHLCPVDGHWSDWSSWTSCSQSCDNGTQFRTRACDFLIGYPHGDDCVGAATDSQDCSYTPCPVDGQWSSWGAWTMCSKSCENGTQTRHRDCVYVDRFPRGNFCAGAANETGRCNEDLCPVDGHWSDWSNWTSCSQTCNGGNQTRHRVCEYMYDRIAPHGARCFGPTSQHQPCATTACPVQTRAVGAVWETWTAWDACSASCGGGMTTRSRNCTRSSTVHGSDCTGNRTETKVCSTHRCLNSCYHCVGDPSLCELSYREEQCQLPDQTVCINRLFNYANGSRTVTRGCGAMQDHEDISVDCLRFSLMQDTVSMSAFNCTFFCTTNNCNKKVAAADSWTCNLGTHTCTLDTHE